MPTEITAVQCVQCKKLHPKEGAYFVVSKIEVRQKASADETDWVQRHVQSVAVEDVIVCNNTCLRELVTLKTKDNEDF